MGTIAGARSWIVFHVINKTCIMPVYLASVCAQEWESSQPKPLQKSSPWSPASGVYVRTAIRAVQSYDNNATEAISTHVNIPLSSAMTMGRTSCKPSLDVSKRSREPIQPITISTPQKIKKTVCILRLGPSNNIFLHVCPPLRACDAFM